MGNGVSAPSIQQRIVLNAAIPTAEIDNRILGCRYWVINYVVTSGAASFSLQFESAQSTIGPQSTDIPGPFAIWPIIHLGANPSTLLNSGSMVFIGFYPWVRLNLTAFTGPGFVSATILGFQDIPSPVPDGGFLAKSAPATGSQAINTQPAVPGCRYVVKKFSFSASAAVAPAATFVLVEILDGATLIFFMGFTVTASVGTFFAQTVDFPQGIIGTVGNTLTFQFSSGVTSVTETLTGQGYLEAQ
jgi:hypothetical protein